MIIKEWFCPGHGYFDSEEPKCPYGCDSSCVERAFLTPPSYPKVHKFMDKMFEVQAKEHGLSDLKHTNEVGGPRIKIDSLVKPSWASPDDAIAAVKSYSDPESYSRFKQIQSQLRWRKS